jgi:hypothetical protein
MQSTNDKPDESVIHCRICNVALQVIAPAHLAKHGVKIADYRVQFPDAPLVSEPVRRQRAKTMDRRRLHLYYDGAAPDKQLFSFLTGALLGDGALEANTVTARYVENGRNGDYLRWKCDLLRRYFPTTIRQHLQKADKRTGRRYHAWRVRTAHHPFLMEWHRQWYSGRKVVPRDLVMAHLDTFALAIWFYDDGHLGKSDAFFYTLAFAPCEVEFLSALLLERFGIEQRVLLNKKGQPCIGLGAAGRRRLLEVIGEFRAPGMAYKLGESRDILPARLAFLLNIGHTRKPRAGSTKAERDARLAVKLALRWYQPPPAEA